MEKILYKKYGNRRLYDTDRSAYVTLEDVARRIREGNEVQVMDARTKEDVTAFTLTQILLEESRKKNFLLPVPLLHLLIRFGENILSDFFQLYLEQVLKTYISYRRMADEQFARWLTLGKDLPPLGALSSFMEIFSPPQEKPERKA
ncbi:MAG TPA: polyhydroxyalkanoate synthesis regulator DNA-binding domain-containing protein [Syntrophales bacterium]|nr:polyhydroxyalkanoate synthesis regulator DNA-binding domain-containing protein [Syntrophales bacterium]HPC01688.1 polyhydroxyalkanoate synthesis regulator DNA-binding domain-containing protein [Syntrophales bacterium]HRS86285.1 polyhydroxyalkanoate synthesis regulator DNA-binding domain-containing protein [Syntrophales bacterium]HRV42690.1 polyhydroxyalkanoate synthesis regulator DNA-binding domain-containing protein [Syntrophales bacterium]